MSKISREDNKKRYKTGMYPTQQDFENVFDSYVHKDDTIDPSKIVSGDENIVDIINRKAEEKHSHEIKDVDGLQAFITKVNTFLDTVDASDDTINRWKEIEAFLQGITDTETLTGLLQDLKAEIEGNIAVDSELSATSEHALQNKVLYNELRITGGNSVSEFVTYNETEYPVVVLDANTFSTITDNGQTLSVIPNVDYPNKAYSIVNSNGKKFVTAIQQYENDAPIIFKFDAIPSFRTNGDNPEYITLFGQSEVNQFVGISFPYWNQVEDASSIGSSSDFLDISEEISVRTETTPGSGVVSLKAKIIELEARLAAVPTNYIEFATDMSAYASAPTGKIVAYFGTTTNDFRRGLFYEKTASGWQNIPVSPVIQ